MANFCIPKKFVQALKDSALRSEIDIAKLYGMSSKERRDFFASHVGDDLGKQINVEFEKAVASNKQNALLSWAESVFSPKEKKTKLYKNVLDKINTLKEEGVLTPESADNYLEDLVADKLGVSVSPEEVAHINKLADVLQSKQDVVGDNLGNIIDNFDENLSFLKAKNDMDNYLQEINPTTKLKVWTGTIGRATMLASVKSPILNIESNTVNGISEALSRRIEAKTTGIASKEQKDLALDYWKKVQKIYQETGYDISRMQSIAETGVAGERVLGETVHAKGQKGITAKAGAIADDIVFKQMMGAPDVAFSAAHFADSIIVNVDRIAKETGKKATDIMKDAMRIKPNTAEGEILRTQAIMDAQFATYTNESWASKLSEGIRKQLNDLSGDIRLGDWFMPFVKTPANVIALAGEYGGTGIPKTLYDVAIALKKGTGTKEAMQENMRGLIRAGLGMTTAAAIAMSVEDFAGEYDPNRTQINELKNIPGNAVKVFDKWYSLDFFGPLAAPLTGMLYAKKYGKYKGALEKIYQYGKGMAVQIKKIPGLDLISQPSYEAKGTAEEKIAGTAGAFLKDVSGRLIPSFISDIATGSDEYVRDTSKSTLKGIQSKIPIARYALPIKRDVFGEPIKTNSFVSQVLAGSTRYREDRGDPTIDELYRLSSTENAVNITDFTRSNAKAVVKKKEKIGAEKFNELKIQYGKELKGKLDKLISGGQYKKSDDAEKEKMIRSVMSDTIKKYTR